MSTFSGNPNHVQVPYLESLNLYFPVTCTLTSPCDGSNDPDIEGLIFLLFSPICGILSNEWLWKTFELLSSESSEEECISRTYVI